MYLSPINYQPRVMQNKSMNFYGGDKKVVTKVIEAAKTAVEKQGKDIIPKVVIPAGTLAAVAGVTTANEQTKENVSLDKLQNIIGKI